MGSSDVLILLSSCSTGGISTDDKIFLIASGVKQKTLLVPDAYHDQELKVKVLNIAKLMDQYVINVKLL